MKKILFLMPLLSSIACANPILNSYEGAVTTGSQIVLRGANLSDPLAGTDKPKFELSDCNAYGKCALVLQQIDLYQPDGGIVTLDVSKFENNQDIFGWWTDEGGNLSDPFPISVGSVGQVVKQEILPELTAEKKFMKKQRSIEPGGQVSFSGVSFQ